MLLRLLRDYDKLVPVPTEAAEAARRYREQSGRFL
jgi:hypothetical protein